MTQLNPGLGYPAGQGIDPCRLRSVMTPDDHNCNGDDDDNDDDTADDDLHIQRPPPSPFC